MSDRRVTLKQAAPRTIAYLRCTGPWRQLPEMLAKLEENVARVGLKTAGPAAGIFHNTPADVGTQDLQWEVFYPVASEIPPTYEEKDRFGVRRIPGARMASVVHKGPYRQAGSRYKHLRDWIQGQGLVVCGPAEEIYLCDTGALSEDQRMEIRIPVRSA